MGNGRKSGARRDIAHGTKHTISAASASNALLHSMAVKSADGKTLHFNYKLHEKYIDGKGRKAPDPERMVHLGKAVTAVRFANQGVYKLSGDYPPQFAYLHSLSKRRGMVVFVDAKTKVVRGFIPVDNMQKWKSTIKERAKKRLPDQ